MNEGNIHNNVEWHPVPIKQANVCCISMQNLQAIGAVKDSTWASCGVLSHLPTHIARIRVLVPVFVVVEDAMRQHRHAKGDANLDSGMRLAGT